MRFFGLEVTRPKAALRQPAGSERGWWPIIREPVTGAWQRNREITVDSVVSHHAVYSCVTLIAADVGKLRPKLVQQDPATGIWTEISSAAFSPVLRKPNRYQNHIQFKEWWLISKLMRGNTYVLKDRDSRGVVKAMYLLDPSRVTVLVADDGSVFYQLNADNLSGVLEQKPAVPASDIIHDRMNCLFHPLVGTSPIFASGLAAGIGLNIQNNAADFFEAGSNPSGVLSAPTTIPKETAQRLQEKWELEYSGRNSGKVAVLGDGLKFEPMRMSAVDSQMIEHLKWSAETICSTFHVPAFKAGVGTMPTYQNAEVLNQIYYSDCLQYHIESMELALDEGLGLTDPKAGGMYGIELDIDALLRMDTATQYDTLSKAIGGALLTPNEARIKIDQPPLPGGNTVYMQQQNYSLAALNKRDTGDNPFPANTPPSTQPAPPPADPGPRNSAVELDDEEALEFFRSELRAA